LPAGLATHTGKKDQQVKVYPRPPKNPTPGPYGLGRADLAASLKWHLAIIRRGGDVWRVYEAFKREIAGLCGADRAAYDDAHRIFVRGAQL
jgi:hypothetical protein